jgi:hypothetical protein
VASNIGGEWVVGVVIGRLGQGGNGKGRGIETKRDGWIGEWEVRGSVAKRLGEFISNRFGIRDGWLRCSTMLMKIFV